MEFQNKNILIIGGGLTGLSAIDFFITMQAKDIFVWDDKAAILANMLKRDKNIKKFEFSAIDEMDFAFCAPGVQTLHRIHPIVQLAKEKSIPVIGDLDLARTIDPLGFHIAITGTNGKSTTSSLVHFILQRCGAQSQIAGNIGIPISNINNVDQYKVFECSSYQLEQCVELKMNYGAILNITPDHLNYHGGMAAYIDSKLKLATSDKLFINYDDKLLMSKLSKKDNVVLFSTQNIIPQGYSLVEKQIYLNQQMLSRLKDTHLLGEHNLQNLICAFAIVHSLLPNCLEPIICAMEEFLPLPHRMQFIGKYKNITFINDSKATNEDSTIKAMQCMQDRVLLIAGGIAKDKGMLALEKYFDKIDKLFLIGSSCESFASQVKERVSFVKSITLDQAVRDLVSYANLNPNSNFIALFSPLCSSLDQYSNFEERGNHFIQLAKKFIDD